MTMMTIITTRMGWSGEGWRFALEDDLEPSVMTSGMTLRPPWSADSWASLLMVNKQATVITVQLFS